MKKLLTVLCILGFLGLVPNANSDADVISPGGGYGGFPPITVGGLPACNANMTNAYLVTDSTNACAAGNALTGGGTFKCPVACNGSGATWLILGTTAASGPPSGAAGGDLGGTYPNPTVTGGTHLTAGSVPNSALASAIGGNYPHTLSGTTPVAVVNSATVPALDIENLVLSANVTSFTLPAAAAVADTEVLQVKIAQPGSGGPWTLPTGTAGSPFTAGTGTTLVTMFPGVGGCPSMPTGANQEIYYNLLYRTSLTEWVLMGCATNPAQTIPYDVPFSIVGTPTASMVIPFAGNRTVNFAANFAGSNAKCISNPAEADTYTAKCAGTAIGTVALSTTCVPTLATTGGLAQTCGAGQMLELDAPATVSGSGMSINLAGTR